jgi:hypothetical protein
MSAGVKYWMSIETSHYTHFKMQSTLHVDNFAEYFGWVIYAGYHHDNWISDRKAPLNQFSRLIEFSDWSNWMRVLWRVFSTALHTQMC